MARVTPHFKVHTSVITHRKMAEVFNDNDLLALWVRLGVHAVERYADRTGDSFLISDRELMALTGKGRADVARTLLSRLADVSPTCASRDGQVWRITLPNFARKQGFGSKKGSGKGSTTTTTTTTTTNPPMEPPPSEGAPARKRAPSSNSKVAKPERFEGEARERILRWAEGKGFDDATLKAGMERFREWAPLKAKTRDLDQWVSAFMRIVREGVESGRIKNAGSGPASSLRMAQEIMEGR